MIKFTRHGAPVYVNPHHVAWVIPQHLEQTIAPDPEDTRATRVFTDITLVGFPNDFSLEVDQPVHEVVTTIEIATKGLDPKEHIASTMDLLKSAMQRR